MADQDPVPEEAAGSDRGVGHARTVSILAVSELAGKAASFVMFAVAARQLGPSEFGQFTWAFNLALLVSSFVVWGFDTALIQLASRDRARLDHLLSDLLAIRALLIPIALLLVAVLPWGSEQDLLVTLVLTLAVLLDSANQAIRSAAAVLARQREVAINLVLQRLTTAGLAITVLLGGGGLLGMSLAYLAGTLVGVALMVWSGRRIGLHASMRLVSRSGARELVEGSTALGVSSLFNMLAFRVDVLLLGWLMGSAAVGAYSAAYKLFETALFFLWSVDRVAMPAMAAAPGDEIIRGGVHRAFSAVLAVYVPYALVMALRGEQVLNLLFGEPYGTESLRVLQVLVASLVPYSMQYLVASGLLARSRNRVVTASGLLALVVNVVANLVLIPTQGQAGAAGATFVAMTAQAAFLWIILVRMSGSPRLLRSALVPALAGLCIVPVLLSAMGLLWACAAAAGVYVVAWSVAARWLDLTALRTVLGLSGIRALR